MSVKNTIPTEFTAYRNAELKDHVKELLCSIGIKSTLKGCDYLCHAIESVYTDPYAIQNVTVGLYRTIADKNGTTVFCVERNCRTAIRQMWSSEEKRRQFEIFACRRFQSTPPVREFVALLADMMRRNLIIRGSVNSFGNVK